MAKPELGTKRLCAGCGAKFYDLNKSPIICPKCKTLHEVAPPPRSRADRAAVAQEEAPEAAEVETVSLEEADAESKTGKVAAAAPDSEEDIEVDETLDDDDDDSTFIAEEEEGEDDVSDIVGDRDSDEET